MRLYDDQYYIMSKRGKNTATGEWDKEPTLYLVTGRKAKRERCYIGERFNIDKMTGTVSFRLQNGRTPEHQPIVGSWDALRWLDANPFQTVRIIPKAS